MSGAYSEWPFACPTTWQETPNRVTIRSEIEDGTPKTRRRFTKTWKNYQAAFRLPWADYDNFWSFYGVDAGAGSQPFYIKHPISGARILVRISSEPTSSGDVQNKPYFDVSLALEQQFF